MINASDMVDALIREGFMRADIALETDLRCQYRDEHERCPDDGAKVIAVLRATEGGHAGYLYLMLCDEHAQAIVEEFGKRAKNPFGLLGGQ